MKKIMFFATIVAVSMAIAMPAQAQSRKDKKTAQKEEWQREQRQKAEEDELRHQIRMDSIANAKKVAEEKAAKEENARQEAAAKAEAERHQAEAEAKAKQKEAEKRAALEEKDFDEPCSDYMSSDNVIYGRGIGEDFEQQLSVDIARTSAIEELASQLSTKVQALVTKYHKQARKKTKRESISRIEGLTVTEVDQSTSFRIACRKTKTYYEDGERLFKTYMVVELSEDQLLHSIYNKIQKDQELNVDADYQSFKKEFDANFKNQSQEVLEKSIEEASQN